MCSHRFLVVLYKLYGATFTYNVFMFFVSPTPPVRSIREPGARKSAIAELSSGLVCGCGAEYVNISEYDANTSLFLNILCLSEYMLVLFKEPATYCVLFISTPQTCVARTPHVRF